MKYLTLALLCSASVLSFGAQAATAVQYDEWGQVLSTTPRYEQVTVPGQVCQRERVMAPAPRDNAGAVLGGISGALLGSQVGGGSGRIAAAAVGAATGAIVGDRIGNAQNGYVERDVDRCASVNQVQSELRGYDVVYEYQGRTYSTFMPYAPGERIRLQVSVRPQ